VQHEVGTKFEPVRMLVAWQLCLIALWNIALQAPHKIITRRNSIILMSVILTIAQSHLTSWYLTVLYLPIVVIRIIYRRWNQKLILITLQTHIIVYNTFFVMCRVHPSVYIIIHIIGYHLCINYRIIIFIILYQSILVNNNKN